MCETLGVRNFCSACEGIKIENGVLVCGDKNGKFYGLPVNNVLCAPCIKVEETKGCSGECDFCPDTDGCEQCGSV